MKWAMARAAEARQAWKRSAATGSADDEQTELVTQIDYHLFRELGYGDGKCGWLHRRGLHDPAYLTPCCWLVVPLGVS